MKISSFFKDNENVLLLNTQYIRPTKDDNTGDWSNGILYLTYRDADTGEKRLRTIETPKTDTFITKPEYRNSFKTQRQFLYDYQADRYTVPYNKITSFIRDKIKEDGVDTEYLKVASVAPKEVFKWRHSYFADYDICDYAMIAYVINNKIPEISFSRAFLDIESDIYGYSSTQQDDAETPINAVSVVFDADEHNVKFAHPKVYTFLLRNHVRYKDQAYFESHLDKFYDQCHHEFDDKYNKPEFHVKVYDSEIIMLRNLFALLHKLSPDFIFIWNMSYDVPAIIKRLTRLGENPINYFCNPDFKVSFYQYNYDNIFKNDFKNKVESFDCTSYSVWQDQMLMYAGIKY